MWEHYRKESLRDCHWGLRKRNKSVLGEKMIEKAHPERTFHKRHGSLFTQFHLYTHIPFPLSSLSRSHTWLHIHTCLSTHTCICTAAAKMFIHAPGCWLLLVIQTSLENKVKMSGSRIEQTDSAYVSVSFILKARTRIPCLFIPLTAPITRYHMLCTYLALHKGLLNG